MSTNNEEAGAGPMHGLKRMLLPAVASLASAVTAYLVKKAAPLIREKLEELSETGTRGNTKDAVSGSDSDVNATDHADGDDEAPAQPAASRPRAKRSPKELEERRNDRARERKERRKAARR